MKCAPNCELCWPASSRRWIRKACHSIRESTSWARISATRPKECSNSRRNTPRTQRGYSIETELRQNRERLNQIAIEVDRGHARRRTNEERCGELTVRTASSEAELLQATNRLMALEVERNGHQQVLDSATA